MSNDLQRRNTWVPAQAPERKPIQAYPIIDHEPTTALSETHLQALETIKEHSTPFDRALAFGVRLLLLCVLWLVLSIGLFIALEGDSLIIPLLVFLTLTTVSYIWLNRQDLEHSAVGLERHKADLAHDLAMTREENDSRRKDKLLSAYIARMLED